MRLWHSRLIPLLDGRRLCDLHMSCCNLRGKGWGKRNVAVGYLYEDPLGIEALTLYHLKVLNEMILRGYNPDRRWLDLTYRGKQLPAHALDPVKFMEASRRNIPLKGHNIRIFKNDVTALQERGVNIELTHVIDYDSDHIPYVVYTARVGTQKIHYGIKLKENTEDE